MNSQLFYEKWRHLDLFCGFQEINALTYNRKGVHKDNKQDSLDVSFQD